MGCEKGCLQKELVRRCRCLEDINTRIKDHPEMDEIPICNIMDVDQNFCVSQVYQEYNQDKGFAKKCDCPQRCNETYYDIDYSISQWPSKAYKKESNIKIF